MNKAKLTVITVCYEAEDEIAETMQSVLRQSYAELEYIIVDGESKDNTVSIAKEIAKQYSYRDVKIISESDKGVYDAMNKGVKLATGEWVCMMNAGDRFADKEVLSKVFSQNYPEHITFIYSDVFQASYNGKYFIRESIFDEKNLKIIHQGVIYRRKLHQEHGYYAVTRNIIVSDYLFFLSIPVEQTFKTPYIIAKYQAHGVSDQGTWCSQQMHCADVVFRRRTFWESVFHYLAYRIKIVILPRRLREYWILHSQRTK
ncbi:glycosyltransferase family 2 protein [Paraprevotella clara]|uniref:glycosyltransferase family 2 protein n=1 Tax=Paraprevotella clara TaxID=454154 RepID=UPI0026760899|nr:glycosyltransferase family 2 protein [Paraprevotella clara]